VLALISLDQRDRQPELMDQPGLDKAIHQHALWGMRRVNAVSGTVDALWRGLEQTVGLSGSPIRVLDIAAGGGDNAIRLNDLARCRGVKLQVEGCDISPTAVEHAQTAARQAGLTDNQFFRLDALEDTLPDGYDVFMCSLFLHHLEESRALELLRRMAAKAARAVLVDDLVRSRFGYLLAWAGGRLLTRSPIIHTDGPLSVRAAFSLKEIRDLAERAGMSGAVIRRHWPQRFLLSWRKPSP
jgi:SAM-dependent methyltransferase